MTTLNFLGFDFSAISMQHQAKLETFLKQYPQKISGYTFASLISWGSVYSYAFHFMGPATLLISPYMYTEKQRHLLQPIGNFSVEHQQRLLNAIAKSDYPITILGVSDQFIAQYPEFCSHFKDVNDRNMANYLYKSADLANLAGRHYEKKRNLIAQEKKLYHWTLHPLTVECHPYCPKILEDIGSKQPSELTKELENELKALDVILTHFTELHQKGYLIRIDNVPAAFSIYEELNPNTAVVHFEKAERKYKGLYQLINQETAKGILHDGYEFINREEDLGVAGLRQAKTSYFPVELISSHRLTIR